MKYSLVTGNVAWSQGTAQLKRGMSAEDDHPLVLERPDLFGDQAPDAELSSGPVIERATAAPGEKRTTPRKSAAKQPGNTGASAKDSAKGGSSD